MSLPTNLKAYAQKIVKGGVTAAQSAAAAFPKTGGRRQTRRSRTRHTRRTRHNRQSR